MTARSHHRRRSLVVLDGQASATGRGMGRVTLAGAGPGDPDLITVKALKALERADVVVHDGLVSDEILGLIPERARRISVAKRKSRHSYSQGEIDRLLVAFARQGLDVVRLKGGDPFVFGRGGEELEACRSAGVPCEVIPGVTAALAASAGAQAPLTHRGAAQAVTFVTAHGAGGETPQLDWTALARANQSVVIYMGLTKAAEIAARLIAAGRDAATPALIVENASLPTGRSVATTLAGLGAAAEGLSGPALLIVGEAMALAEILPCATGDVAAPSTPSGSPSPVNGGGSGWISPCEAGGVPAKPGRGAA
ncbi:MAG TPA: uroporphyrinogen-III C-methyltransferase [Caulobacteraceae bacterium]